MVAEGRGEFEYLRSKYSEIPDFLLKIGKNPTGPPPLFTGEARAFSTRSGTLWRAFLFWDRPFWVGRGVQTAAYCNLCSTAMPGALGASLVVW